MSSEELQVKIDEYCGSQAGCEGCVFHDAVNMECLASVQAEDTQAKLEYLFYKVRKREK